MSTPGPAPASDAEPKLTPEAAAVIARARKSFFFTIGLLILGATVSLEWAAISRIGYGIIWFGLYATLMKPLTGFAWRGMLIVYAQSLLATLATVIDPPDTGASGICELPSSKRTRSTGTPRASAATWLITV